METCPDCGFEWASVPAEAVPERITTGAGAIAALVRAAPDAALRRSRPERWSTLEYAAHVRDVLVHIRDRLVIVLVEDDPTFKPLYREQRVDLGLYAGDQPDVVADELDVAARLFARTFARLEPTQLERPCQYAVPTPVTRTLCWVGQQAVHEVEHHRGDVEQNAGVRQDDVGGPAGENGGRRDDSAGGSRNGAGAPDGGAPSARATVRRKRDRGAYDRATIEAVLDEALVAHVGVVVDGAPVVLPTLVARVGDQVYLHGAAANAVLRAAADGEVCVTATLLDGLVLARSAFNHSANYRSVVVFGRGREVSDATEKRAALDALVDHIVPGRTGGSRAPTTAELRATLVVAIGLDEASAKVRTGPPLDDDEDKTLTHWAGVVPLRLVAGAPEPAPDLTPGIAVPAHVRALTAAPAATPARGEG